MLNINVGQLLTWLIAVTFLSGSGCRKIQKFDGVYIMDGSASVDKASMDDCYRAVESSNGHLKRGSRLAFIPVTSDAAVNTPGRIMRIELSESREAYDDDKKKMYRRMASELREMQKTAIREPYQKTDLLGAIGQAAEEFAHGRKDARRWLVILSDFLQDDGSFRFTTDSRMKNEKDAAKLAREFATQRRLDLRGASVYLGMVRSHDLETLSPERRAAVRAFWREFLKASGASAIEEATDGPGLLAGFVQKEMQ